MTAVVVAIAHKHTFRFKEQSILTSRAGFANHLPRISILSGSNDRTACVWEGGIWYLIFLLAYAFMFFVVMQTCFHLVGVI